VQSVTRGASSMNNDKSPSITAYETYAVNADLECQRMVNETIQIVHELFFIALVIFYDGLLLVIVVVVFLTHFYASYPSE
jgi:hypothetical protein